MHAHFVSWIKQASLCISSNSLAEGSYISYSLVSEGIVPVSARLSIKKHAALSNELFPLKSN